MGTTRTPEVARRRAKKAFPSTRCVCVRKATTGASACSIQQKCFFCFQPIVQHQQPWKPTPNRANEETQAKLPRGKTTSLPVLVHLPEPADEEGLAAHQQGHEREVPQLRGRTTTTPLTSTGVAQTTATPLHDGTTTGTGDRGARLTHTTTWTIKRPTPTTTCKPRRTTSTSRRRARSTTRPNDDDDEHQDDREDREQPPPPLGVPKERSLREPTDQEGPEQRLGGQHRELPEIPEQTTTTTTTTTTTHNTTTRAHAQRENPKRKPDESERKPRPNLVGALTTTPS